MLLLLLLHVCICKLSIQIGTKSLAKEFGDASNKIQRISLMGNCIGESGGRAFLQIFGNINTSNGQENGGALKIKFLNLCQNQMGEAFATSFKKSSESMTSKPAVLVKYNKKSLIDKIQSLNVQSTARKFVSSKTISNKLAEKAKKKAKMRAKDK